MIFRRSVEWYGRSSPVHRPLWKIIVNPILRWFGWEIGTLAVENEDLSWTVVGYKFLPYYGKRSSAGV